MCIKKGGIEMIIYKKILCILMIFVITLSFPVKTMAFDPITLATFLALAALSFDIMKYITASNDYALESTQLENRQLLAGQLGGQSLMLNDMLYNSYGIEVLQTVENYYKVKKSILEEDIRLLQRQYSGKPVEIYEFIGLMFDGYTYVKKNEFNKADDAINIKIAEKRTEINNVENILNDIVKTGDSESIMRILRKNQSNITSSYLTNTAYQLDLLKESEDTLFESMDNFANSMNGRNQYIQTTNMYLSFLSRESLRLRQELMNQTQLIGTNLDTNRTMQDVQQIQHGLTAIVDYSLYKIEGIPKGPTAEDLLDIW